MSAILTSICGQVLLNSAWATALALLLAVAWRWLSPRWRWFFGLLVTARLLVPTTPLSAFSGDNLVQQWLAAPRIQMEEAPMDSALEPVLPPVVETTRFAAEAVEASAPVRTAAPIDLRSWVAAVWLAGAVAAGVWLIVRHAAFLRWCRLRRTTASAEWHDDLALCAGSTIRSNLPALWEVDGLASPVACGLFRPAILIPAGMGARLTQDERRHVLAHELAHLRAGDMVWNLVFAAARVLHWFNPLVHAGIAELCAQREVLRDARAVADTAPSDPGAYGATLLKLMSLCSRAAQAPATSFLPRARHLRQRITMIHTDNRTSAPARIAAAASTALIVLTAFTAAKEKPAATGKPAAPATAPQKVSLLDAVVPVVAMDSASLPDAATYLSTLGPKVKVTLAGDLEAREIAISMNLRNARLRDALDAVCQIAGTTWTEKDGIVVIGKAGIANKKAAAPAPAKLTPAAAALTESLKKTSFGPLSLKDMPMDEAVGLLRSKSRKMLPPDGVNFILRMGKFHGRAVTVEMEGGTLLDAIVAVCKAGGSTFKVGDSAVEIDVQPPAPAEKTQPAANPAKKPLSAADQKKAQAWPYEHRRTMTELLASRKSLDLTQQKLSAGPPAAEATVLVEQRDRQSAACARCERALEKLEAERVRLGIPESAILPARVLEFDAEGKYTIRIQGTGGKPDDSRSRQLTPTDKATKARIEVAATEYRDLIAKWETLQRKLKAAKPNDAPAIQVKIDDIVTQLKEKELEMTSLQESVGR